MILTCTDSAKCRFSNIVTFHRFREILSFEVSDFRVLIFVCDCRFSKIVVLFLLCFEHSCFPDILPNFNGRFSIIVLIICMILHNLMIHNLMIVLILTFSNYSTSRVSNDCSVLPPPPFSPPTT